MNLKEKLTKENFWNEMMEQYPKATSHFCKWIDEYKKAVNWDKLFNQQLNPMRKWQIHHSPKFHQIPYEMQQGIWIAYATETLEHCFEQPEYVYSGDLQEDIKSVLSELEELCNS